MAAGLYRTCDLLLSSNVPLPELSLASALRPGLPVGRGAPSSSNRAGREPDCRFELLPAGSTGPPAAQWFHKWLLSDGGTWLAFGKLADGFVLHFPDLAQFVVSRDGGFIRCVPALDVPRETIRHLLLDQVVPLVLSHRGRLVLHASAVVTPSGAVGFLGASGQGKSTLAASLSIKGLPLLTDDCVVVTADGREYFCAPSYPGVRLWPHAIRDLFTRAPVASDFAHYTSKQRIGTSENSLTFANVPTRLRALYVLDDPPAKRLAKHIAITAIVARDAVIELVKHTYQLDSTDRTRRSRTFAAVAGLASSVPVRRLTFPRDFSFLSAVCEAIEADAAVYSTRRAGGSDG